MGERRERRALRSSKVKIGGLHKLLIPKSSVDRFEVEEAQAAIIAGTLTVHDYTTDNSCPE